jgi:hypothetical protein
VKIGGTRYRLVERKAEVGEKVVIVNDTGLPEHNGRQGVVVDDYTDSISVNVGEDIDYYPHVYTEEYRVLEPITDETHIEVDGRHASPEVIDLLANLARRVTSLEQQLADTQGNVEKLAEELATKTHEQTELIEMALDDIVTLDERTQPKETPFFTTYQPTFHINTTEVAEKILDEFMKAANFGGGSR